MLYIHNSKWHSITAIWTEIQHLAMKRSSLHEFCPMCHSIIEQIAFATDSSVCWDVWKYHGCYVSADMFIWVYLALETSFWEVKWKCKSATPKDLRSPKLCLRWCAHEHQCLNKSIYRSKKDNCGFYLMFSSFYHIVTSLFYIAPLTAFPLASLGSFRFCWCSHSTADQHQPQRRLCPYSL